jgi:hypothetical protein
MFINTIVFVGITCNGQIWCDTMVQNCGLCALSLGKRPKPNYVNVISKSYIVCLLSTHKLYCTSTRVLEEQPSWAYTITIRSSAGVV